MTKKQVLVIGLGRFGYSLATSLFDAGHDVLVLDRSEAAVEGITSRSTAAYVGDAQEAKTLESIGATECDLAVITFGEDFESTVLATATLKAIGINRIISRASTQRQADVLLAIGAQRVLQLEADMGTRLATELLSPPNPPLLEVAEGYQALSWTAAAPFVGQSLGESQIYARFNLMVVALMPAEAQPESDDPPLIRLPRADYTIREGDTLMLIGADTDLAEFFDRFGR